MELMQQLQESVAYIKKQCTLKPTIGLILGSGLGNLIQEIKIEKEIAYEAIPHFPVSTVQGHGGKLLFATYRDKNIIVMSGRFHTYEGYNAQQVSFPIRVMKLLGVATLLLTNAAGSVNPNYKVGDIVIINDYISFFTENPLIGKNLDEFGPRFPDVTEAYSKSLIKKLHEIANVNNIKVHDGVYVAVTGPSFETKAEYRFIKLMGADVVGMSTVQETIVAVHCGIKVGAVSVVTDEGLPEIPQVISHEEVLHAAKQAEPKVTLLFKELFQYL